MDSFGCRCNVYPVSLLGDLCWFSVFLLMLFLGLFWACLTLSHPTMRWCRWGIETFKTRNEWWRLQSGGFIVRSTHTDRAQSRRVLQFTNMWRSWTSISIAIQFWGSRRDVIGKFNKEPLKFSSSSRHHFYTFNCSLKQWNSMPSLRKPPVL